MIVDIGKGVQQNDLKQVALSSVKLGAHVLTKGSPFAMLTLNLGMDAVDTIAKDPQGYSRYLNQTRQLARGRDARRRVRRPGLGLLVQPLHEDLQFLHHLLVAARPRCFQAGLPGRARGLVALPQAGLAQPLPGHRIVGIEFQRHAQMPFGVAVAVLLGVGLASEKRSSMLSVPLASMASRRSVIPCMVGLLVRAAVASATS